MTRRRDFLKFAVGVVPGLHFAGLAARSVPKRGAAPLQPIAAQVPTTLEATVVPGAKPALRIPLSEVGKFKQHGYGTWKLGGGLKAELRTDLMLSLIHI